MELLPLPDVATQLNVPITAVHQLVRDGQLVAVHDGGVRKIPADFVQDGLVVKSLPQAGKQRPGLLMSVEDDGPGIEPDNVDRVLQRGVRGDERVQGHGIGLSIVQDIVRAYQGELAVDRSAEFGGARFSVTLPPG